MFHAPAMCVYRYISMNICVIFPHPDDAALNAAGTLARWVEEGHEVTAVCCTRGNMGTLRLDQTAEEVGQIRSGELIAANAILGIQHTEILDHPDGCVLDAVALRKDLVRCIRHYRPERVVTMDPWARYEVHRDHITVGQMASEAAAFACFPLLYPEHLEMGLKPHNASEVWYMGLLGKTPNTFVSIEDQLEKKVQALLKFEATMAILDQLFSDETSTHASAHEWIRKTAAQFGCPVQLAAAEAFVVQRCAPGHFDNMQELNRAILGEPADPPRVIR